MTTAPSSDFLAAHSVILSFALVAIGFLAVNLVVWWLIRPRRFSEEKRTTYECGENPQGSAWVQFNIRFYVFALLFIIFDVEVAFNVTSRHLADAGLARSVIELLDAHGVAYDERYVWD
jgi:NADH-quinone oxidoreductase subunit A